jgi:hypothetical protein
LREQIIHKLTKVKVVEVIASHDGKEALDEIKSESSEMKSTRKEIYSRLPNPGILLLEPSSYCSCASTASAGSSSSSRILGSRMTMQKGTPYSAL